MIRKIKKMKIKQYKPDQLFVVDIKKYAIVMLIIIGETSHVYNTDFNEYYNKIRWCFLKTFSNQNL